MKIWKIGTKKRRDTYEKSFYCSYCRIDDHREWFVYRKSLFSKEEEKEPSTIATTEELKPELFLDIEILESNQEESQQETAINELYRGNWISNMPIQQNRISLLYSL